MTAPIPVAPPAIPKRRNEMLTLEKRIEVIYDNARGVSQRQLAAKFKCGKTQIYSTLANKERYLSEWMGNENLNYKRKRQQPNEVVNVLVWEWFQTCKAKKLPVNGPLLQKKAREYAASMNIEHFSASNGWLESFKKRHNIIFRSVSDNSTSEHELTVRIPPIPEFVEAYEPRDVYNVDEIGLHYQPSRESRESDENVMPSERITVVLCMNSAGEKEPVLVISRCPPPQCWSKWEFSTLHGVVCKRQPEAWMTLEIFCEWLKYFNEKMKSQKRNVLLLLDDAPCHPLLANFTNIRLQFLPVGRVVQPLDHGVTTRFKQLFLWRQLRYKLAHFPKQLTTARDVVGWVVDAWRLVEPVVVQKSFEKCGIAAESYQEDADCSHPSREDTVLKDIERLAGAMNTEVDVESICKETLQCYSPVDRESKLILIPGTEDSNRSNVLQENEVSQKPSTQQLQEALASIVHLKRLTENIDSQLLPQLLAQVEDELETIMTESVLKSENV